MKAAAIAIIGAFFLLGCQRTQPKNSGKSVNDDPILVVTREHGFEKPPRHDVLFELLSISPLEQSTPFARWSMESVESDDPSVWVEKLRFLLGYGNIAD